MPAVVIGPDVMQSREDVMGVYQIRAVGRIMLPDISGGSVSVATLDWSVSHVAPSTGSLTPVDTYCVPLMDVATDYTILAESLDFGTPISNDQVFATGYSQSIDIITMVQAAYAGGYPALAILHNYDIGITVTSSSSSDLRVGEFDVSEFLISTSLGMTYTPGGGRKAQPPGCLIMSA